MKAQIPWLRVFVEGVVIVGSILMAFGIDAWWDGVQEREEEERILAALEDALASGYREFAAIDTSSHFAALRTDPRFQALLAKYEN